MVKAREVHSQLVDIMQKQQVSMLAAGAGNWDAVRKAITSAYFYNSAKIKGIGEYVNMLTGIPSNLHPSSALFGLGYTPDYVTYHELIMTGKEYMSCVTAVEGEWLAEAGPMFFTVKESYKTRLLQKAREDTTIRTMNDEMKAHEALSQTGARSTDGPRVIAVLKGAVSSTLSSSKKHAILTPGLKSKDTPRRTPMRLGL